MARKRLRSFCQKCMWQVSPKQAIALDPTKSEWADYAVQAQCGNLSVKTSSHATRQENTRQQSSQLADPPWTDPGLESGTGMCKLILTFKNERRKCGRGMKGRTFSPNACKRG